MDGVLIGILLLLLLAALVALGLMGSKQAARLHSINQAHTAEKQGYLAKIASLEAKLTQIDFVHATALNIEKQHHAQALQTLNDNNVQRQLLREVEGKLAQREHLINDQQTRLAAADNAIKQQSAEHIAKLQQLEVALKPMKAQFEQSIADNQKLQTMVKAEQEKAKELQSRLGEQQTQYIALKGEQSALQKRLDSVLLHGADGEDLIQAQLKITRLEDSLKVTQTQNTQITRQLRELDEQKQQLQAQQAQQNNAKQALNTAQAAANNTPTADMAELLRRAKEYDNVAQALKQSEAGLKKAQARMAELEEKLKTADALKAQWGSQANAGNANNPGQAQTVLLAATPTSTGTRIGAKQARLTEQETQRLADSDVLQDKLAQLEKTLLNKTAQIDTLNTALAQHSKPNAAVEKELTKTKKQLEHASVRIADLSLALNLAQEEKSQKKLVKRKSKEQLPLYETSTLFENLSTLELSDLKITTNPKLLRKTRTKKSKNDLFIQNTRQEITPMSKRAKQPKLMPVLASRTLNDSKLKPSLKSSPRLKKIVKKISIALSDTI